MEDWHKGDVHSDDLLDALKYVHECLTTTIPHIQLHTIKRGLDSKLRAYTIAEIEMMKTEARIEGVEFKHPSWEEYSELRKFVMTWDRPVNHIEPLLEMKEVDFGELFNIIAYVEAEVKAIYQVLSQRSVAPGFQTFRQGLKVLTQIRELLLKTAEEQSIPLTEKAD